MRRQGAARASAPPRRAYKPRKANSRVQGRSGAFQTRQAAQC